MQFITAPIATLCMGMACSAASFLLMGGEPGRRMALTNASVVIHQPLGGFRGQASDIAIHAANIQRTKRRLIALYAYHCGQSETAVEKALDRDNFMDAEQARDWGLIDSVMTRRGHQAA